MARVEMPKEYSNEPIQEQPREVRKPAPSFDAEMRMPTPREQRIAKLTEENMKIPPQFYNVTNKNPKALRVIHDFEGQAYAIPPGETRENVMLQPHVATRLGKGDLEVVAG
jgi:hypothetical protein